MVLYLVVVRICFFWLMISCVGVLKLCFLFIVFLLLILIWFLLNWIMVVCIIGWFILLIVIWVWWWWCCWMCWVWLSNFWIVCCVFWLRMGWWKIVLVVVIGVNVSCFWLILVMCWNVVCLKCSVFGCVWFIVWWVCRLWLGFVRCLRWWWIVIYCVSIRCWRIWFSFDDLVRCVFGLYFCCWWWWVDL